MKKLEFIRVSIPLTVSLNDRWPGSVEPGRSTGVGEERRSRAIKISSMRLRMANEYLSMEII